METIRETLDDRPPREGGDQPASRSDCSVATAATPRGRGSTRDLERIEGYVRGHPARAGINP